VKVKVVSAFFQDELQEVFTRLGCKVSASELGKVLKDADANKAPRARFRWRWRYFLGATLPVVGFIGFFEIFKKVNHPRKNTPP